MNPGCAWVHLTARRIIPGQPRSSRLMHWRLAPPPHTRSFAAHKPVQLMPGTSVSPRIDSGNPPPWSVFGPAVLYQGPLQ
jgi:hypothetical protein